MYKMQHAQGTTLRQAAHMLPPAGLAPPSNAQRGRGQDTVSQQQQGVIDGNKEPQTHLNVSMPTTVAGSAAAAPSEAHSAAAAPGATSSSNGGPTPAPESSYCFGPAGKKERLRRIQISGDTTWVIPQRFRFLKRIGSGAYGCVASFEEAGENGSSRVAVKKIGDLFRDLVDAKRILREIKILKALKHENLIDLIEILDPLTPDFEDIYLVSDLMDTDLHRVIYSRQPLTHEHHQYFLYQILLAVAFLHEADVIHRDLKPSNVLVNLNCDVKICDFGLARGVSVPGKTAKVNQQQQQQQQQDGISSSRLGDSQMSLMDTDAPQPQAAAGKAANNNTRNAPCTRLVGNAFAASLQRPGETAALPSSELGDLELTDYVVTRWYRPPELLIFPFHYSKPVDIWSVGCIMAELLGRRALFAGKDQYDQLRRIVRICGSPSPQDLSFLVKEAQEATGGKQASKRRMRINRQFIEQLPASEGICFSSLFPDACPEALDLLRRLLAFNPSKRITALEALRHPYFRGLYCPDDEPKAVKPMDWGFDNFIPNKRLLQNLIYKEILSFHPDIAVRDRPLLHTRGISTQQLLPLLPCTQGATLLQSDQKDLQQQKQQQRERQQQGQHPNPLGHRSCCSAPAASSPQPSQEELRQQPLATGATAPVALSTAAAESSAASLPAGTGIAQQVAPFCSAALSLHAQKQQQQQQQLLQGFHLSNSAAHHQLMQQRRQALLRQQQSPYCPLQQEQQQLMHTGAAPPRHSIGSSGPIRALGATLPPPVVATAPSIPLPQPSHYHQHMQQQQQRQQQQQQQQLSPRLYTAVSTPNDEPRRQGASAAGAERLACFSPLQHNLRSLQFPGTLQQQPRVANNCCGSFCCESRRIAAAESEGLLIPNSASTQAPQHHTTSSTAATTTDAAPRSSGSAAERVAQQQRGSSGSDSGCCTAWPTTGSRNTTRSSAGEEAGFGARELYPQQQQQQQMVYLHRLMQQQMARQQQLIDNQKSHQQQQQFPQDQLQQLHLHTSPLPQLQQQGAAAALRNGPDYRSARGEPAAAPPGYSRWVVPPQHQPQQQHYPTHN